MISTKTQPSRVGRSRSAFYAVGAALAAMSVPVIAGADCSSAATAAIETLAATQTYLGASSGDYLDVGSGCMRDFAGGTAYWSSITGAHEVHGAIKDRYLVHGGPSGELGFPTTDETATPDTVGRYNHFENGSLYYFPWGNAYMVRGAIRDKWANMGWENSVVGYPISDEMTSADGQGVFNRFQYGVIYSHPTYGAFFLKGNLLRQWDEADNVNGIWGWPIADHRCDGFDCTQEFEGGALATDPDLVDMRSVINAKGITISNQNPRGTCSVMAMNFLQEYGYTDLCGWNTPWADLSEEYLNHVSNLAYDGLPGSDRGADGAMFFHVEKGYNDYGVIWETMWPYRNVDDYDYGTVVMDPTWIPFGESTIIPGLHQRGKFIQPNDSQVGMTDDELAETFMNLRHGIPVALGRGHSQVAVGYYTDASAPGGGYFIMRNSYGDWNNDAGYQYFDYDNIQNGIYDGFAYLRKMDTQVTYGPVSMNLWAFDSLVHGEERVAINDRARMYAVDNSWATVTAGRSQGDDAQVDIGYHAYVGDILSRGSVSLRSAVVDGDVTCRSYSEQNGTTVSGTIDEGPVDPYEMLRANDDYFDGMFENVDNLFVENGETEVIYAGVEYGDIYVRDGGSLVLSGAGAFYVRRLTVDAGGAVDMAASRDGVDYVGRQVALYSPNDLSFGPNAYISGAARNMLWVTLGNNVYIGPGCFFHGTVAAPHAAVNVDTGSTTQVYGAFHGRTVTVHQDSEIIHAPFWY